MLYLIMYIFKMSLILFNFKSIEIFIENLMIKLLILEQLTNIGINKLKRRKKINFIFNI